MPRTPRGVVVDPVDVGVYHCVSRCVRRAYLCGVDSLTGRSFEHRRQWIQDRMRFLAGIFGIDVLAFAVMSNHLHIVLRNRPDVVASWSDDDVARRWWRLFPLRRGQDGSPAEPEEHELAMFKVRQEVLRSRLADVSWFMRCLSEGIARKANKEDDCTGRFWEGRYKCQPLLDESALLACMAYVDLNPVRAGIAATPEGSMFTSAYERIAAEHEHPKLSEPASNQSGAKETSDDRPTQSSAFTTTNNRLKSTASALIPRRRDDWLAPLELERTHVAESAQGAPLGRASHRGCLPVSLAEYLRILDWTGRQLRRDKRGAIPADLLPILERLQIQSEQWVHLVKHYRSLFRSAAGRPESLTTEAERRQRRWTQGVSPARQVFS